MPQEWEKYIQKRIHEEPIPHIAEVGKLCSRKVWSGGRVGFRAKNVRYLGFLFLQIECADRYSIFPVTSGRFWSRFQALGEKGVISFGTQRNLLSG
jgi:hypothetical protein